MIGQPGLLDELVKLLALAVGQRVHRIDDDGAGARASPAARARTAASMIGMKKQSDLPEPVPGRDDEASPLPREMDRLNLGRPQIPVGGR